MKHFNSALIWGLLKSFKEKQTRNNSPYLDIEVECNSREYGNVIAFCRIWSKTKLKDFKEAFKVGDTVYLKAFLDQYTTNRKNRKKVTTNFNVYEFSTWDPESDQHKAHRAVFILKGTVNKCATVDDGDERLEFEIRREDESKTFELFITAENKLGLDYMPEVGVTARVKGVIAVETDQYNDIIKGPRPVIEQVKVEGAPEESAVPF